jgi:Uma2 family endonuclease
MTPPPSPHRRDPAMSAAALKPRADLDLQAYLDWEAAQPERHEYIAGEISAMTGAHGTHNLIAGNVYMALRQHLRGSPCRTHIEGMTLQVRAADAVFYPDVFATRRTWANRPSWPKPPPSWWWKCCPNPPPPSTAASSSSSTSACPACRSTC